MSHRDSPEEEITTQYRAFVDALVERRRLGLGNATKRVRPKLPDLPLDAHDSARNTQINRVLNEMTPEQLEVVRLIADQSFEGGMHDVLFFLQEQRDFEELRILRNGVDISRAPYEEIHYDWLSRLQGEPWPE
jgi:hypothetical protein